MPIYNFHKDLPVAQKTEEEVSKILESAYNAKIKSFNHDNKYDILATIGDKDYTFEVKEDFTCARTGNVGVEYECRGKASGIAVSKADYYIYKIHTKNEILFVLMRTTTLKAKIENKKYFRTVNGGDIGSNSLNYLFKLNAFLENTRTIARA